MSENCQTKGSNKFYLKVIFKRFNYYCQQYDLIFNA